MRNVGEMAVQDVSLLAYFAIEVLTEKDLFKRTSAARAFLKENSFVEKKKVAQIVRAMLRLKSGKRVLETRSAKTARQILSWLEHLSSAKDRRICTRCERRR